MTYVFTQVNHNTIKQTQGPWAGFYIQIYKKKHTNFSIIVYLLEILPTTLLTGPNLHV